MSTKKNSSKKASQPSTPLKSAFKSGKLKASISPQSKDKRNLLFVKGHQNGIMVAYLQKYNREEEPFLAYDMTQLRNNPDICELLNINIVASRKGVDGTTPMKQNPTSEYDWRALVCIIGEDSNTAAGRKQQANNLIMHFNNNAISPNYDYPKKVKFGGDLTVAPLSPVDVSLLDNDVCALIAACFPDNTLEEIMRHDDILNTWWSDIEHGREVMEGVAPNIEG